MTRKKSIVYFFVVIILILGVEACKKDTFYESPPPHVPVPTATLEAKLVSSAPGSLTAAYWKTADYLKINCADVSTNYLFSDGLLNMTGTYKGKSSFNNGGDPGMTLKAAYDNTNIYILAEWTDNDVNLAEATWLWNGPADAIPTKTDTTGEWTSQRNNDKLAFAFEIQNASNSAGSFSSVGCAASCHVNGNNSEMRPDVGKVDIWNWSLARSSPLGYLRDMIADNSIFSDDAGTTSSARNSSGTSSRSGPAYEWNGNSQKIILPNGQTSILDPAFYLLDSAKTPLIGDAKAGEAVYHKIFPGNIGACDHCHGYSGGGAEAAAINGLSMNKKTRQGIKDGMDKQPDMTPYLGPLSAIDRDNVITFIRGLCGVPGYILMTPTGSCADIKSVNNVTPVQIANAMIDSDNKHAKYQVLIIRKLNTGNADDVQFDLTVSKTFRFGVAVMNSDSRNHIGSNLETLTFK